MDIKVITRHAPSNYGSLLQSIATQTVLERFGYTCEIIDYIRDDEHGLRGTMTALRGKREWSNNPLKKMAYLLLRYPEEKLAEVKFADMRERHLKLTQRCCSHEDLRLLDADVFMTGSDQVWGPTMNGHYDEAYFLSFVEDRKKTAYAASFGRTDFTPSILEEYKSLLSSYSGIVVRENTAVDLLLRMGIRCAGQVLDPTLLLDAKDYNLVIGKQIMNEKYIFVYMLEYSNELVSYCNNFSKEHNIKVIYITNQKINGIKGIDAFGVGPDMFLEYIKNAEYVITNSFHATVFSIIFNKKFVTFATKRSSSRMVDLLNNLGMPERIYKVGFDINKEIDYKKVKINLNKMRKSSLEYLNKALNRG